MSQTKSDHPYLNAVGIYTGSQMKKVVADLQATHELASALQTQIDLIAALQNPAELASQIEQLSLQSETYKDDAKTARARAKELLAHAEKLEAASGNIDETVVAAKKMAGKRQANFDVTTSPSVAHMMAPTTNTDA